MRTRTYFDLEGIQREAQARRLGRDLYIQAAAISQETVEALSAVLSRLAATTVYGQLAAEGFSEAMLSDAAVRHISNR